MSTPPPFVSYPKIPRLKRGIVITEKIDGTNAQVFITEAGDVFAGSRNRWITPQADNYGFARWVEGNKTELLKLGPGQHFGEWWGQGIQRGYGLKEKRFSLFNVSRWENAPRPECCGVVPKLFAGNFAEEAIQAALTDLRTNGSKAEPGFMKPEGVVVFFSAAHQLYKVLLENDEISKEEAAARQAYRADICGFLG